MAAGLAEDRGKPVLLDVGFICRRHIPLLDDNSVEDLVVPPPSPDELGEGIGDQNVAAVYRSPETILVLIVVVLEVETGRDVVPTTADLPSSPTKISQ